MRAYDLRDTGWIRIGLAAGIIVLAILLAVFLAIPQPYSLIPARKAAFWRLYRDADRMAARHERAARLTQIWQSLIEFKSVTGHWPKSFREWSEYEPQAVKLVRAPEWSIDGDYVIHFENLGTPNVETVIEDPGFAWPPIEGHYIKGGTYLEYCKVALRSDGWLISDGKTWYPHGLDPPTSDTAGQSASSDGKGPSVH